MAPKNNHLFLVYAMSRSGHHAIIDWIYHQFAGPKAFVNYMQLEDRALEHRTQYYINEKKYLTEIDSSWSAEYRENKLREFQMEDNLARDFLFHQDKNLLLMNFENVNLSALPLRPERFVEQFGSVAKFSNILIMRDLFNWLASKIKGGQADNLVELLLSWESQAREYLGLTNNLLPKILINYNRWCQDLDYRQELAGELGADTFLASWEKMLIHGGGSSFDGLNYATNASRMDLLKRFEYFKDDNQYRDIIAQNRHLVALSEQIFGVIAGTEIFKE